MTRETTDPGLDVHETAYVRGAGGPVDDTGVHTSRDTGIPPERHEIPQPTRRSLSGEPLLPNLRASLRSREEVERERAEERAAEHRAVRRLAVPIALVALVSTACGASAVAVGTAAWWFGGGDDPTPTEHEGIPIRRLGDEPP